TPRRESHDRRGGRRARASCRGRGRLRHQGDQRDRRSPVREGGPLMIVRRWLAAAVVAVMLAACSGSGGSTTAPSSTAPPAARASSAAPASGAAVADLQIYGAASLKAALAKIKGQYEAANPGTTLTVSTDSSAALETKIEQGAPADVFLSADTTNPKKLVD